MAKDAPRPSAPPPAPEVTVYGIVPVGGGLYRLVSRKAHPDSLRFETESDTHMSQVARLVERVKR